MSNSNQRSYNNLNNQYHQQQQQVQQSPQYNKIRLKPLKQQNSVGMVNTNNNLSIANSSMGYNSSALYTNTNNNSMYYQNKDIFQQQLQQKYKETYNQQHHIDVTMGNIRKTNQLTEEQKKKQLRVQTMNDFKSHIIGFRDNSFLSPFNVQMQKLHSGINKSFILAEQNIQNVIYQKSNIDITSLFQYTQNSLAYSYNINPKEYIIFPIIDDTCKLIVSQMKNKQNATSKNKREEFEDQNGTSPVKKQQDKEVVIFVAPDLSRYAIYSWIDSGSYKIVLQQNDQFLNIQEDKLRQNLENHKEKQRIILVKQKQQLKQLQNHLLTNDIIVFYMNQLEDIQEFLKETPQNLTKMVDFFFVYTGQIVGCQNCSNFLIMNKKYENLENQFSSIISNRYQENSIEKKFNQIDQEIIKFYRTALILQYQAQTVTLKLMKQLKQSNEQLFNNGVQRINGQLEKENQLQNYIQLYGFENNQALHFNIIMTNTKQETRHYQDIQNKWIIHPQLVTQLLDDIFGIQVREQNILREDNFEEVVTFVAIENYYIFESYEIEYILQALKQVCLYFPNIQESYSQDNQSGRYKLINQKESQPYINLGIQPEQRNPKNSSNTKGEAEQIQNQKFYSEMWKNQLVKGEELFINHAAFLKDQNLIQQISKKYQQQQNAINPPQDLQAQFKSGKQQDNVMENASDLLRMVNNSIVSQKSPVLNQYQSSNSVILQQTLGQQNVQPSILFNNNLTNQSKRSKNIQEIFFYYIQNQEVIDGKMNLLSFQAFAVDFKILDDYVNEKAFQEFLKSQNIGMKGMTFVQFCQLLEELSRFLFKGNQENLTIYDMMEELFTKILYIQDPTIYRTFFGSGNQPIDPRQKAKLLVAKKKQKQEEQQSTTPNTTNKDQQYKTQNVAKQEKQISDIQKSNTQNNNNKDNNDFKNQTQQQQQNNKNNSPLKKPKKKVTKKPAYGVEAAYNDLFADETFLGLQQKNQQEMDILNNKSENYSQIQQDNNNNNNNGNQEEIMYLDMVQNQSTNYNNNNSNNNGKSNKNNSKFTNLNHDKM